MKTTWLGGHFKRLWDGPE